MVFGKNMFGQWMVDFQVSRHSTTVACVFFCSVCRLVLWTFVKKKKKRKVLVLEVLVDEGIYSWIWWSTLAYDSMILLLFCLFFRLSHPIIMYDVPRHHRTINSLVVKVLGVSFEVVSSTPISVIFRIMLFSCIFVVFYCSFAIVYILNKKRKRHLIHGFESCATYSFYFIIVTILFKSFLFMLIFPTLIRFYWFVLNLFNIEL